MTTLSEIKEWCAVWQARGTKGHINPKTPEQTAEWLTEADRQWQACQGYLRDNNGEDGDPQISGRPWTGTIQAVWQELMEEVDLKIQKTTWEARYFAKRITL